MISFQPIKTRTFRGLNTYERFGQAIVNKYKFVSKPYLGMLNLLFLEPVNDNWDEHKQNLYNYMIVLRMQLEKQKPNKAYHLSVSRPFIYQMLEKILVKQSVYGSELKAYRNYLTQLNRNNLVQQSLVIHSPVRTSQSSHPSMRSESNLGSFNKAFTTITVNPISSIGSTNTRMDRRRLDHQMIYHYRKPLIESIWMNRIASNTTVTELTPLVNELYQVIEDNHLLHAMSTVERIVLNNRILEKVYAYGSQHHVVDIENQPFWNEQTIGQVHNSKKNVENSTSYRNTAQLDRTNMIMVSQLDQSYDVSTDRLLNIPIELLHSVETVLGSVEVIADRNSTINTELINLRSMNDSIVTISNINLLRKQYYRQLADSIWNSTIIRTSDTQSTEQVQDYTTAITRRNRLMLNRSTSIYSSIDNSIFDLQTVSEKLKVNEVAALYMLDQGTELRRNVELTVLEQAVQPISEVLDRVRSLTSIVNRTANRSTTAQADDVTSNELRAHIRNLSKQYKRQLTDSIWISTIGGNTSTQFSEQIQDYTTAITRRNRLMLNRTASIYSNIDNSIFDLRTISDKLKVYEVAALYMLDQGSDIQRDVEFTVPDQAVQPNTEVIDIVKSLTSIVNRSTNKSTTTHADYVSSSELRADIRNLSKQYKRQLTDSIWISTMGDSASTQPTEQIQDHTATIVRRNRRMLNRTNAMETTTLLDSIFDLGIVAEKLKSHHQVVAYMLERGVATNDRVQLTVPVQTELYTTNIEDVVKSHTSIVNRTNRLVDVTDVSSDSSVFSISSISNESNALIKQYKRQLAHTIWLSRMIDRASAPVIERLQESSQTLTRMNKRMLGRSTATATSIINSVFDQQLVVEKVKLNQSAIEYMLDYGVDLTKPVEFTVPTQIVDHSGETLDVVQSLTRIVNRSTQDNRTSNVVNLASDNRSSNLIQTTLVQHEHSLEEIQAISNSYYRRLSDSVWLSKMAEVSERFSNERYLNDSTRISRRNKRILHHTMVNTASEVFDQRIVGERLLANRRALNYLIDSGVSIEKPVPLVNPAPNMEPELIQDVVKAITKIEFGNTRLTRSLNKYVIQQYRRQLTESIWVKQIQDMNHSTSKQKNKVEEHELNSQLLTQLSNHYEKLDRVNKRMINQAITTKVSEMFNHRVVSQRLQHNKYVVQHLHEQGIPYYSSPDLLLSNTLMDHNAPINEVVKAVVRVIAHTPSLSKENHNRVIPLDVLRQYRQQLTDSMSSTSEKRIFIDHSSNTYKQHSHRVKVSNPIIQMLQQKKVSGSLFDSLVIDERIFRDVETIRRNRNIDNRSIEQRTNELIGWLIPKSSTTGHVLSTVGWNEHQNSTSNLTTLRRLQLIRTGHHHLDSHTLETVRAYTANLFTSTEIDYLHNTISGNSNARNLATTKQHKQHKRLSMNLMNTKITWLQGVVDHLAKTTTLSNSRSDRLSTPTIKPMNNLMHTFLQPLFDATDASSTESIRADQDPPNVLVHSSPTITLDTLNDELTHRIDQEASLDYLIPQPTMVEAIPQPTVEPVNFDVTVDQDKVSINPLDHINMTELVDKLYEEIERKMTFEQQRRGF